MTEYHNNEKSVILGSSIHNERIEQLWYNVSRSVISPFKDKLLCLEERDVLDADICFA